MDDNIQDVVIYCPLTYKSPPSPVKKNKRVPDQYTLIANHLFIFMIPFVIFTSYYIFNFHLSDNYRLS